MTGMRSTADPAADRGPGLALAPDAKLVSIGFGDDWSDTADVVHCASPNDVQRLLARRGSSWRRRYGAMFECEVEQYEAAIAIGVESDSMCFRVGWRRAKPAGQLTRRWFGVEPVLLIRHSAPKLAIAAIYAAPTVPTPFDLERLVEFGYVDVVDVAERVRSWNAASQNGSGQALRLPVPRSAPDLG